MSISVQCTLVLQAADSSLQPADSPTASAYPNRVVSMVPPELSPLVDQTASSHTIPSGDLASYRNLASGIVASSLGSPWQIDSTPYASGHMEQNGQWVSASGYIFRIMDTPSGYYEDSLPAVSPSCVCRYLLSISPVV